MYTKICLSLSGRWKIAGVYADAKIIYISIICYVRILHKIE